MLFLSKDPCLLLFFTIFVQITNKTSYSFPYVYEQILSYRPIFSTASKWYGSRNKGTHYFTDSL